MTLSGRNEIVRFALPFAGLGLAAAGLLSRQMAVPRASGGDGPDELDKKKDRPV